MSRLHDAHRARLRRLTDAATAEALAKPDPDFITSTVLGGQVAVISSTDAYLSLEAGLATGTSTEPWGIDASRLVGRAARGGRFLEDVYGRLLNSPGDLTVKLAREVATDLQLAQRYTAGAHVAADRRITRWRRITGGSACPLCSAAASRTYSRGDLQAIHQKCDCTVSPEYVTVKGDPVDRRALNQFYDQLGSRRQAVAVLGRIATREATVDVAYDAELGPVLALA